MENIAGTPGFEDSFNSEFESADGTVVASQGEMREVDGEDVVVMRGAYTYVDDAGQEVTVSWYADETGYHAESEFLPVAPAIPFPEQAAAVEAQIAFAAQEAAAASRSSGSRTGAASNSYQAAAPVARQQPTTTYYVSQPAPAPAPVVERVAGQPSAIYYKPIDV